ncbi:endonuclease domain-containing protein [Armatimonas rosea]|uniref:Very-short-patch-repair endonuclease n=1 Tax=Armatimonas rosea TaxID=685828 RepID=A0A7W9SME2_ARMRO|nr:endonuclease domain-containing protein [Armatimonas rosea]MBB6049316.1 very-short-patch-repair endonuclease [Armatimonas rosea]
MRDVARRLRHEATDAERVLWELLRGRRCFGYRFLRQRALGVYVVDFYCPALHLAVEVDGGVHEQEGVWQRDAHREAWLLERGVTVVHLTNEEVFAGESEALYRQLLLAVGKYV